MLNENELILKLSPNYTEGRQGTPVRHITFHHIVGPVSSAISRFSDPNQQVSTHFAVGANAIYCFVDTDNTAWGNGNWPSNLDSVSIEHEGTWLNGYRNEAVINNSARLVAWLRSLYPNATPNRHRDVFPTACPGELPVEEIWNKATILLNPAPVSPPPPPTTTIQVADIPNKQVRLVRDANLWDLHFTKYSDAKAVQTLKAGTVIEASAIAKNLSSTYYLSEYSFRKGIINGINVKDCEDVVKTPTPPAPKPEPVVIPAVPSLEERVGALEKIVNVLKSLLGLK